MPKSTVQASMHLFVIRLKEDWNIRIDCFLLPPLDTRALQPDYLDAAVPVKNLTCQK